MVSFDSTAAGTSVAVWDADPRLHDRPALSVDGIDELLVVAAHPDDETLGAGALIAACSGRGIPVTVVVATDGAASGIEGIAQIRATELAAAASVLGTSVISLGFPDGATREHVDELRSALAPLISRTSANALIVAPWRGDGHRDHRVVGEIAIELARGRATLEYPIWMWHWATPSHPEVPWDRMVSVPATPTKSEAISQYSSQTDGDEPMLRPEFLANFARERELLIRPAVPPADTLSAEYFDNVYQRRADPWSFETRWYEQRKRALTVAILPDERYQRALEIGCSIGVLTETLADRSDSLLALDISQAAVDRARQRLGDRAQIERADVSTSFPSGQFDLIVLSEVGYYFGDDLAAVLDAIEAGLAEGGTLVACHWRHPVEDYPRSGDEVHAQIRLRGLAVIASHVEEDFLLEVFSPDPRSVARRTGLL